MTRAELKKESEIIRIMKGLKCSREEAEEVWADDNSDEMTEEQAELERKAKENGTEKHRGESTKERKPTKRERKVDIEKGNILKSVAELLNGNGAECEPMTNEVDLHFTLNGNRYSIKLTKHREKKGG